MEKLSRVTTEAGKARAYKSTQGYAWERPLVACQLVHLGLTHSIQQLVHHLRLTLTPLAAFPPLDVINARLDAISSIRAGLLEAAITEHDNLYVSTARADAKITWDLIARKSALLFLSYALA